MRFLMPLLALLALSACALPPAMTIAAAALSGTSYLTTGKGPTDHALSVATRSDCNFLRAVISGPRTPLCLPRETTRETTVVASAEGPGAAPPQPAPPQPAPLAAPPQPAPLAASLAIPGVSSDPGMTAAIAPAAGFPAIDEAIARRDAARRLAGDEPAASDAIDRVAEADITAAVIASIASHPQAVAAIVAAAVGAAPEHRATITARASAAFPGFAAAIAWAASAPPAAPIRLADATQQPAA